MAARIIARAPPRNPWDHRRKCGLVPSCIRVGVKDTKYDNIACRYELLCKLPSLSRLPSRLNSAWFPLCSRAPTQCQSLVRVGLPKRFIFCNRTSIPLKSCCPNNPAATDRRCQSVAERSEERRVGKE